MAQELEPIVRIRDLQKDRVNFVLENVDMSYVVDIQARCAFTHWPVLALQIRFAVL